MNGVLRIFGTNTQESQIQLTALASPERMPIVAQLFSPATRRTKLPTFLWSFAPIIVVPSGAEGVFPAPKSNIPWSIKWVRAFSAALNPIAALELPIRLVDRQHNSLNRSAIRDIAQIASQ
jgi:hypothetical protein